MSSSPAGPHLLCAIIPALCTLLVLTAQGCGEAPDTTFAVAHRLIPIGGTSTPRGVPESCTVGDETRPALGCVPVIPVATEKGLSPEGLSKPRRYRLPASVAGRSLIAEALWEASRDLRQKHWQHLPRRVIRRPGEELRISPALPPAAAGSPANLRIQVRPIPPATQSNVTKPVTIGRGAVLAVGIAIDPLGTDTDAAPVEFRLAASSPAGEQELMRTVLDPAEGAASTWADQRLDLGAIVGQSVRFAFSTQVLPRPGQSPEAAFSFPLWGPADILEPRPRGEKRNLLLVSLDTLRADYVGAYGSALPTTPELDRLAAAGSLFEQTICAFPSTTASHMSMLTGVYPSTHRIFGPAAGLLPAEIPTLAEILAAQGYQTAAVTEAGMLARGTGFSRDVTYYRENTQTQLRKASGQIDVTFGAGLAWLRAHRGERFFLFLHTYQVHWPYEPPPAFDIFPSHHPETGTALGPARAYAGEVRYTDSEMGRLLYGLEELGETDRTIVIVTSDHGEGFAWEHGWGHTINLYDEALLVPLILRSPGLIPAGVRVPAQVSLVDIVPTVLDLLGLSPLPAAQGSSLVPLLHDPSLQDLAHRVVFAELKGGEVLKTTPLIAARTSTRKWILSDDPSVGPEVYDLRADPGELDNIASTELVAEGEALIEDYRTRAAAARARLGVSGSRPARPPAGLDERELEKLRALGYIE